MNYCDPRLHDDAEVPADYLLWTVGHDGRQRHNSRSFAVCAAHINVAVSYLELYKLAGGHIAIRAERRFEERAKALDAAGIKY